MLAAQLDKLKSATTVYRGARNPLPHKEMYPENQITFRRTRD